jgi:DNA replication and repair protein RecF
MAPARPTSLEALSLLAPGRGLRRAGLDERWRGGRPGPARWAVAARLSAPMGGFDARAGDPGGVRLPIGGLERRHCVAARRRQVRIDGRPAKSQAALADWLAVVVADAGDGSAVPGGRLGAPALSRPAGLRARSGACRHRVVRLRLAPCSSAAGCCGREGGADPDSLWLSALEDTMAANGVAVAAARRDFDGAA